MPDFATSADPEVQAQLDRLPGLGSPGDQLGLERITALLERLGNPQDRLPPVIHVAGTNGKGSTCAFLRAILEAAGLSVHMFTSPHLVRFNERIRIAGELVGDADLAALLKEVLDASEGLRPSFFEVATAAAMLAFSRTPADACILEVGLGGRLDATNVVQHPLVCAIAGLGLDHSQWLGRTLGDIAAEKAGIAKRDVPLVTQRYPPLVAQRVQQTAEKAGAQWVARGALWESRVIRGHIRYHDRHGAVDLPMPELRGRHQAENAALAVAVLRHQEALQVSPEAMAEGIRSAHWPARLQRLDRGPLVDLLPEGSELWVDGGHNGAAARFVADYASTSFSANPPLVMIFGCLTTKDPKALLRPFARLASAVETVPIPGHDSRSPADLAAVAEGLGLQAVAGTRLKEALTNVARPARVLIFGSLYLAGVTLKANGHIPD